MIVDVSVDKGRRVLVFMRRVANQLLNEAPHKQRTKLSQIEHLSFSHFNNFQLAKLVCKC